jgi:predicted RNA binding protein YcfA (HicA-like mRNA interferase family)
LLKADLKGYERVAEVIDAEALLTDDGWQLSRTRGSHRQFRHEQKPGTVTVAGKPSDDVHPKTLGSILKQAGLDIRDGSAGRWRP